MRDNEIRHSLLSLRGFGEAARTQGGRAQWLPCWRVDFGNLDVPESFTRWRHACGV
jgi:hypothetical protein